MGGSSHLLHCHSPDLSGHLLQGDTAAESKVAEVQKGHAQALILKVMDLFLTRQVPQRHHIIHELMFSLRGRGMHRKGEGRCLLYCQQTLNSLLLAPCGEGRDKYFPRKSKCTSQKHHVHRLLMIWRPCQTLLITRSTHSLQLLLVKTAKRLQLVWAESY